MLAVENAYTLHASLTIESLGVWSWSWRWNVKTFVESLNAVEMFFQQTLTSISFCSFSPTDLILAEGNSSSVSINQGTTFITGPYLDGNGISNVTTQISTHAYLPCKVSFTFEPQIISFLPLFVIAFEQTIFVSIFLFYILQRIFIHFDY